MSATSATKTKRSDPALRRKSAFLQKDKFDCLILVIPAFLAGLFFTAAVCKNVYSPWQMVFLFLTMPAVVSIVLLSAVPYTRAVLLQLYNSSAGIQVCSGIRFLGGAVLLLAFLFLSAQLMHKGVLLSGEQFYGDVWCLCLGLLMCKCPRSKAGRSRAKHQEGDTAGSSQQS